MYIIVAGAFSTEIITNSSGVVYSWASGPAAFHGMINEVIKSLGITDKKSEDVFDVFVLPDRVDEADEYISDFWELAGETDPYTINKNQDWREYRKLVRGHAIRLLAEGKISTDDFGGAWGGYAPETRYLISTKDGKESPLGNMVESLFSHEGDRGG